MEKEGLGTKGEGDDAEKSILSEADEVLVVGVDVRQLDVNKQKNLKPNQKSQHDC